MNSRLAAIESPPKTVTDTPGPDSVSRPAPIAHRAAARHLARLGLRRDRPQHPSERRRHARRSQSTGRCPRHASGRLGPARRRLPRRRRSADGRQSNVPCPGRSIASAPTDGQRSDRAASRHRRRGRLPLRKISWVVSSFFIFHFSLFTGGAGVPAPVATARRALKPYDGSKHYRPPRILSSSTIRSTPPRRLPIAIRSFAPCTVRSSAAVASRGNFYRLTCAADGSVWVGLSDGAIKHWKDGRADTFAPPPGEITQVTLLFLEPGGVWAGSGADDLPIAERAVRTSTLKEREDGPWRSVQHVCRSRTQHLDGAPIEWTGSSPRQAEPLTLASPGKSSDDIARCVFQDRHGNVWVRSACGRHAFGRASRTVCRSGRGVEAAAAGTG